MSELHTNNGEPANNLPTVRTLESILDEIVTLSAQAVVFGEAVHIIAESADRGPEAMEALGAVVEGLTERIERVSELAVMAKHGGFYD